jgi:hypothetical protein
MKKYSIKNWSEYNTSLVARGSLTVWVDDDITEKWQASNKEKRTGHPQVYSDEAILMALTIRFVYNLPLRALEGFLGSVLMILGLSLKSPCYTQICRRAKNLEKALNRLSKRRPTDIVFDSTGLKVYGEGEWKVRMHGTSKRRTWRKLHIAMDPNSGEVVVAELTENSKGDAQVAEDMIDSVPGNVQNIYGDGAYDSAEFRKKIHSKGAKAKIPPPRNAVIGKAPDKATSERNLAVQEIKGLGGDDHARSLWKKLIGYHRRSLVETTMFRFKQIFGGLLRSRSWINQKVEALLKCQIINRMTNLGMPIGFWKAAEIEE